MCIGFVVAVTSSKLGKDGGSSIETLEVEEPESEMLAEEISAEELYIIRTRSNEYILIVDARLLLLFICLFMSRRNLKRPILTVSQRLECFSIRTTRTEAKKQRTTMLLEVLRQSI